jgi:cytochrome P450
MSTLFFYLLHYPDALRRATTEIRTSFETEDDIVMGPKLASCCFLQACIDETLRLNPVLSLVLPREVKSGGTIIDGEFFKEGSVVGTSIYAMHRNEEFFPEPNVFRPER